MVSPGMTSTSLISNLPPKLIDITAANNPLKRIAKPKDVANVILFLAIYFLIYFYINLIEL